LKKIQQHTFQGIYIEKDRVANYHGIELWASPHVEIFYFFPSN